jgi:hypothetical protein
MSEKKWNKLVENGTQATPSNLVLPQDECYYTREYLKEGFSASASNQLVWNFQISPTEEHRMRHKKDAIEAFVSELGHLMSRVKVQSYLIAPMPTSKVPGHPEYDDRLIQVLQKVAPQQYCEPIVGGNSHLPSKRGGPRHPSFYSANYVFKGFSPGLLPSVLFVLDDVLTSGSHFRAYKDLMLARCPGLRVVGIFWALTIDPKAAQSS